MNCFRNAMTLLLVCYFWGGSATAQENRETPDTVFAQFSEAYFRGESEVYFDLLTNWGRRNEILAFLESPSLFRNKDFCDRVSKSCDVKQVLRSKKRFEEWLTSDAGDIEKILIRHQQLEDELVLCVKDAKEFVRAAMQDIAFKPGKRGRFTELADLTIEGDTANGFTKLVVVEPDGERVDINFRVTFRRFRDKWRLEFSDVD